ncbi:MAG TPA: GNAT family N-acetyltransferase [Tabrizicola sp.]|nr:GNAT family N-acetyltransferase [Tabrizicola sp.]
MTSKPQKVRIRPLAQADRAGWDVLYQGYAEFYRVAQTPEMRDRVWSWLHDPAASQEGLVAEAADGQLIGLAHYRPFSRPLSATTGGFLDDLFVAPEARGSGAAEALLAELKSIAASRGWSVVRRRQRPRAQAL